MGPASDVSPETAGHAIATASHFAKSLPIELAQDFARALGLMPRVQERTKGGISASA